MTVLLLNASYEPLTVIDLHRAVTLVWTGKAEIVTAGPGRLRSPSTELPEPVVVRLCRYVKVPFRARAPLTRRTLAARDGGRCQVSGCDRPGTTIDHVTPRAKGGLHRWENVVAMCPGHNSTKSDRLLADLGWTLKTEPVAPRFTVALRDSHPAWTPYLAAV